MIDMFFMEVDIPHFLGIKLSTLIRKKTDKLIFTTSHAKYALDDFDVRANGFLLKPFNLTKFIKTMEGFFDSAELGNKRADLVNIFM